MANESSRFIIGSALAFGMGLFGLQFQALGKHPFTHHSHLYALCQVAIVMAFFASAAFIRGDLLTLKEGAGLSIVLAFTCLMWVGMSGPVRCVSWIAFSLLMVWKSRGFYRPLLETGKKGWKMLTIFITANWPQNPLSEPGSLP
ncbi:hypothetical protein AMTR_s00103p00149490 [Amborella trichopoda]|uniref:Uncharacterized protein n=1 Tax=Amborella trichopoda TaxID=13333 RepID=W1P1S5_AMBTC|nr:hypothetical protein AMTR_s00103p00149490 [Amborella trichopoda]